MSLRILIFLVAFSGLYAAHPVSAHPSEQEPMMTEASLPADCPLKLSFADPASVEPWRIVNDGVMGGHSQGTRFHEDDHMVFTGNINTNGGGFSSLRARLQPGPLAGTEGMRLKLRSDGRAYRMTFRTSSRWRGRSVSYQVPIPKSDPDRWTEVSVSFEDMDTSVFGRSVRADLFDPADIREIGIILADGQDGPFRLDIAQMNCA